MPSFSSFGSFGQVTVGVFDILTFVFLFILQAAISALKLELGARERCSQEQECVETTVHIPLGILKAEIGKPVSNPRISCSQIGSLSSDSEPDTEIDILDISRIMATANGRNQEFVKSEPVSSGWDAIHEDESMRNNNFSKLLLASHLIALNDSSRPQIFQFLVSS